jgi:O-antigen/teichoic acid export membrane protein
MAENKATDNGPDNGDDNRARVAGGAGFAFLGRMGAIIEALSIIAFTWLYGAATFGLFAVLWSYVKVTTAVADAAMTTALQRFVPRAKADGEAEQIAGYAFKLSFLIACVFALAGTIAAPYLAPFINAADGDAESVVTVIQIYVWVLPFWTLVEVATASIRARRTFGPEIRVRIFYEQGLRLVAAAIFALLGWLTYGLFLSHLVSVVLAALLALRLVSKHYDLKAIAAAPLTGNIPKKMRQYGFSVMPSNIIRNLFSEFPVMFLNFMLPGAAGAAAGGYYAVARKIASALQSIGQTFEYVMAPLAAEKDGSGDQAALKDMYGFATRITICVALPFGAALVLARHDILAAMKPEFQAASAAIAILCIGRVFEAATGPSSAMVEMLGHRFLSPFNGIMGFATLLVMGFHLIPLYGVTGAAVAAATGLNVMATLALLEVVFLFKLVPYDRNILRPLGTVILLTAGILALVPLSSQWPAPAGIIIALSLLFFALFLLVRIGLTDNDAEALGKASRLVGRKSKA